MPVAGSMPRSRRWPVPLPPATMSNRSSSLGGSTSRRAKDVRIAGRALQRTSRGRGAVRSFSTRADSFSRSTTSPSCLPSPPANCTFTEPRKTCDVVVPSLPTSTPNSVPRSVTMAVGVRTANRG